MRAAPLVVNWHNENSPIYSVHFEPHGKGRLATAGGDNNVRLWRIEQNGEQRKVIYLTTLSKHTQAVNVVRFCPKGEMVASAGDDGNVLLWVPAEHHHNTASFGEDDSEDKETWRLKHMVRAIGSEIYDLAWSPDGKYFITGSMDNVARIYDAHSGQLIRQIAEHNHYVQGVAWDPLNEFVATQSSDRSVHIYKLKSKDGQFSLATHHKVKDLPNRRTSTGSPAPPDLASRASFVSDANSMAVASPVPSTPGTPTSVSLPMNPPVIQHSRHSSFSSSPSMRRSTSPAPSLPLPAVKPLDFSPKPQGPVSFKTTMFSYANETMNSFFRRLTFTPDGSLLLTPAGQYKVTQTNVTEGSKTVDDVINTVYIYTRAGLNKPPVGHLPGLKKSSVAVRCSPVVYTNRRSIRSTKHISIDTSSAEEGMNALPEPAMTTRSRNASVSSEMEPPPLINNTPLQSPDTQAPTSSPKERDSESPIAGPTPTFALPYRLVYAVATQDAVLVYDTQQQTPLCVVSNLHYASFTDLAWSQDGLTLLMSSSDGFCSSLSFLPGELGTAYSGSVPNYHHPTPAHTSGAQAAQTSTPGGATPLNLSKLSTAPPLLSPTILPPARPASPARSISSTSTTTMSNPPPAFPSSVVSNPTPTLGSIPSMTAAGGAPLTTPPETPLGGGMSGTRSSASSVSGASTLGKRDRSAQDTGSISESDKEESTAQKKRRIAPTLVSSGNN